jgi:hypothetical protein
MPIDKAEWMSRFSEHLLTIPAVRQKTLIHVAREEYAFESEDPEESAWMYALDATPSSKVGGPE